MVIAPLQTFYTGKQLYNHSYSDELYVFRSTVHLKLQITDNTPQLNLTSLYTSTL